MQNQLPHWLSRQQVPWLVSGLPDPLSEQADAVIAGK
jgi:hypothetical protein